MADPSFLRGCRRTNLVIAHSGDAGKHWVQQPLTPLSNSSLAGKSFIFDDERAWIARSEGGEVAVARTQNGAISIATTKIRTDFGQAAPLAVVFLDALNGFVSVGDGSSSSASTGRASLYRTSDGGRSFHLADPSAPVPMAFADQSVGWGEADGLYLTIMEPRRGRESLHPAGTSRDRHRAARPTAWSPPLRNAR